MKSYYSTFIRLLFCLVGAVLWSARQTNVAVIKEVEKVAAIVYNQFVPDSREDIHQIHSGESGSSLIISVETTSHETRPALLSQCRRKITFGIDSIVSRQ